MTQPLQITQAMLAICHDGRFYIQIEYQDGTKFTSQKSWETADEAHAGFREFALANGMDVHEFKGTS